MNVPHLDDNGRSGLILAADAWIVLFLVLNPFSLEEAALSALGVALKITVVAVFRFWKRGESGEGDKPPPQPESV